MKVHDWWDAAASIWLGSACPTCGAATWGLCPSCDQTLRAWTLRTVPASVPVVAAHRYAGVWRQAIIALKERQAWSLARPLGAALGEAVEAVITRAASMNVDEVTLVPMPSRPAVVRARGADSTLLLARSAARTLRGSGRGVRVRSVLTHTRRVADQTELAPAARRLNLDGALRARPVPWPVVLVDDLTTSGASLHEAVRALRASGSQVVGASVVCDASHPGSSRE